MATIEPTGLVMAQNLLTLNDVFPDALTGNGIFNSLTGFEFNPDTQTASYLDFDYFGNYSGDKIASKLIHKLADESGVLSNESVLKLAGVIKARFTTKWEQLWLSYAIQPWFDNVALTDTGSTTGNTTEDKSTSANESQTNTRNENASDSTKGINSVSNVRTGSVETSNNGSISESETQSGSSTTEIAHTGSVVDAENASGIDSTMGFNSVNNFNPVSSTEATNANTRTFQNKDVTTETPNTVKASVSETGNKATQQFKDVTDVTSGTDSTDKSHISRINDIKVRDNKIVGRKTGSVVSATNNVITGYDYRRQDKIEALVKMFSNPNLFPFFEIVYGDVDSILCIPLFK